MRKILLIFSLFIGVLLFNNNSTNAQGVTTASINGIVTDSKGAIPGATVTITHLPTGSVYSTVSRGDGRFNLPNLRVGGPYTFKVSFIGYSPFIQENITLSIGQDQRMDAKLQENNTTLKEVTVTGAAGKVINSSRTGARETINRQQIEALPTINRSLTDFAKLTPSASSNTSNYANSFGGRSNLFNNITVDGALFNNSFGLSGTLGGQTNSQPISLDAIDQIQVDIAPFDVRQGNFTGAGVNTVVKSGTNQVKGTIYDYVRGPGLTGYKVDATRVPETHFTYRTTGASIGAPIIKNKLFLFVSGEQERKAEPPTTNYIATRPGVSGANVSQVPAATLDQIASLLKTKYGYDPGPYENYNYNTYSDKLTAKLDWNIDKNNVLSAKYFYLKSYRDVAASNSGISNSGGTPSLSVGFGSTRAPGTSTLPFFGSGYRINNNFNIGIIELDTRISNSMSNKLTVGYSALRDYRKSLGSSDVPMVDIGNGVTTATGTVTTPASATATSFGYELYTAGNLLTTNIWQFADDYSIFAGKHEITIGTSNQMQSYINGFAPDYNGLYTYNSASDFLNGLPAAAYTTRYSALPDGSFPYAKIKASIFSLYAQDKVHITDNFRLTYGLRADYDVYPTSLASNSNAAAITFQQGIHVDVSKLPKNRVQLSPRIGFNWDVNGDQSTQVRGGTGLFAGTVPFVWISNQASNNGLLFGSYTVTKNSPVAQQTQLIYNPNVNANRPALAAANASYELDAADPNLKYPKIFRTNLAVDQKLPWGIIGTIEGSYSKDINAIYHQNLVLSDDYTTLPGVEGQIRYASKNKYLPSAPTAANPAITGMYYMTNTNKGYSYFITGQLQKSFSSGLYANIAYTHTTSKDVNDGGSTASTIWSGRAVDGNPNGTQLTNSSYVQPSRIIATVAYRREYGKNYATSVGLTFEAANNGAISYVTANDPNNDGGTTNDLMYIPKTQNDLILVQNGSTDTRTPTQIWNQLNAFISQDKYLNTHRGQFAERNGAIMPYFKRADLNITQDFYVKAGKTKNTIRLTLDMINIGNFLNRSWGTYKVSTINGASTGNVSVLRFVDIDPVSGRARYTVPYLDANNQIPISQSYKNDTSILSRWQAQLGIRYIFN